jgi:GT2 family glycosyltransferase
MTSVAVVIPFRDRGRDPLRAANLIHILDHWDTFDAPLHVVDDGRTGTAAFNRSAAYNLGRQRARDADVIIFTESDMLIDFEQIHHAIGQAVSAPGLVVPFTQYRYLSEADSAHVRAGRLDAAQCQPESTMEDGRSIGAINVISADTLDAVGQWDESFEGSWYDDNAMRIAFEMCAGPTRWVTGPAHHLYHLPGWTGSHLTDTDRAATTANRHRLRMYRHAHTADRIRDLTTGRR